MKTVQFNYLLVFVCLLLFTTCTKDEINNEDNVASLSLDARQVNSSVKVSWEEINVSTFVRYQLVRATEPIPARFDEITSGIFVFSSDNFEDIEFEDDNIPFVEKVYYRMFVDIGSRMLVSEEVAVEFERIIIPSGLDEVVIDKVGNMLYVGDRQSSSLYKFDYGAEKLIQSTVIIGGNNLISLNIGRWNNQIELYAANSSGTPKIYNADLQFVDDIFGYDFIDDIELANGFLFITQDDFFESLVILDRSDLSEVNAFNFGDNFDTRLLGVVGDGSSIVEVANNRIDLYHFDDNGELEEHFFVFTNFSTLLHDIVVSDDGQHFMPYEGGQIYDLALNEQRIFPINYNEFLDFAFSESKDRIYALEQLFFNEIVLNIYAYPSRTLLESRSVNGDPTRIFVDGNKLLLLGEINSGSGIVTLLEKIDI